MHKSSSQEIHFLARPDLEAHLKHYIQYWGQCPLEYCKVITVLGGDGFMLSALSQYWTFGKPFYGLKFGNVGHLMNEEPLIENLELLVENATPFYYLPLSVEIENLSFLAFNDVCLYRQRYQALKFKITIDTVTMPSLLTGDGILCSSILGKSAYYASSDGIPFDIPHTLGVRPLNCSSLTNWKGTTLFPSQTLIVELFQPETRPVILGWDGKDQVLEPNYKIIKIRTKQNKHITLLKNLF
ncbi:putative inorganic polyphosphate/ATP-NAD kinase [Holospora obtusa F1]|uniref:Inorganic polyphosphate/ATP-NAD kinase n=1 Tax=Holospora obtusa F1 TaxID=1399147 RepID=W6TD08_HOLOB|nr:hypothetical protein [Holospora obtusa]ETZ06738.1 putative inorganic polyphosphate/ATP-NAD kinase [Holospora obtusa F1]